MGGREYRGGEVSYGEGRGNIGAGGVIAKGGGGMN